MKGAVIKYIKDNHIEKAFVQVSLETNIIEIINMFYEQIGNYEIKSVVIKNYA
jgi:hypothetical protein